MSPAMKAQSPNHSAREALELSYGLSNQSLYKSNLLIMPYVYGDQIVYHFDSRKVAISNYQTTGIN